MIRVFVSIIIWGRIGWAFAQPISAFKEADVSLHLTPNGSIHEVFIPADSGRKAFDAINFWIGGKNNGNIHLAANHTSVNGTDFFAGPLKLADASAPDTTPWRKLFYITREQIETHRVDFNKQGYTAPPEILNWPGSAGPDYAKVLAPFSDLDGDLTYEPLEGEVPYISGKSAVCVIFNDNFSSHQVSGANKMGVEVLLLIEEYENQPKGALFLTYYIYNRSALNYDTAYMGLWSDFSIGKRGNEYVATDSLRNMYFAFDNSFDSGGFGNTSPATGIMFLNRPMQYSISHSYDNNGAVNSPSQPTHFYNYLRRIWKDDSQLSFGGDGYNTSPVTNYIFSGNPCDFSGWTEKGAVRQEGERNMLGTFAIPSFASKSALKFKAAIIWSRSSNSAFESVCRLQEKADAVKVFHDSLVKLSTPSIQQVRFSVYPNPSSGNVSIVSQSEIKTWTILDLNGKIILSGFGKDVNVSALPQGIYILNVNETGYVKFVKE